jgi:DNA helicase-2/ATP-dependent DNA helicase PcrA
MGKKPSEAVKFVIQETGMERVLREGDAEDEERLLNIRELVTVAAQYDDYVSAVIPAKAGIQDGKLGDKEKPTQPRDVATQSLECSTKSSLLDPSLRWDDSKIRSEEGSEPISVTSGVAGIEKFLENAALASDQDDLVKDQDAVKLMTVHASKGLEFDHVFITGLEQDLFPFKHIDDAGISPAEQEEERRLFYVALTRARNKVHLSHTIIRTVYGAQRVNTPSEFIDDIEKDLIEEQIPEKPSGAKALFIDF